MRRFLVFLFLFASGARQLSAQRGTPVFVRVEVHDSSGSPIPGVNVVLLKDSTEGVLYSVSDSTGRSSFTFDEDDRVTYSISTRKVGYTATQRTLDKAARDTVALSMLLTRVAALDTIRVVAAPLKRERQPYLGAAEIAASSRSILSLRDAIGKLRPEIDYQSYKCVVGPQPRAEVAPLIPISHGPIHVPLQARVYVNGRWVPSEWDPWNSIYAEHVAEIRFVNCLDSSIPGLPEKAWPSVYVLLKPGYAWDPRNGSYAIEP